MPVSPKGTPPKEAIAYFERKGLKPGFSYLDVWKQEHAHAFTVAKLTEIDLLADVRDSISKALENGQPFEQWADEIEPTLDKSGWSAYGTEEQKPSRLKRIYNTNMRVARAVGQWDRIERTKRVLPYLKYELGPSEHHREEHVAWAEAPTILPIDDPWWGTHMPPNGWGCKCWVRQIGSTEAESLGGESQPPDEGDVSWENPKTGETEEVPAGIDPGWDINPGKDRTAVHFDFVPLREKPKFTGDRTWVEHFPGLPEVGKKREGTKAYFTDIRGNYVPERGTMHADIIETAMVGTKPMEHPTAIVMMGGAASGKTTLVKELFGTKKGEKTVVENFVIINADDVKEQLPEYETATKDPTKTARDAAAMVHEESSDVAKQLLATARKASHNLVFDGTGANADKYEKMIAELKAKNYRVELIFSDVEDPNAAIERAVKRANETGRWVPEKDAREAHAKIPPNFEKLASLVDSYTMFASIPNKPHEKIIEGDAGSRNIIDPGYWRAFKERAAKLDKPR